MGNELLKKTSEGILLKCLGESEAYLALADVHNGHVENTKKVIKWDGFYLGMPGIGPLSWKIV